MFVPYVYKQFENRPCLEFSTFDEAVDVFFSKAQEQQFEVKKEQQEKTVIRKLEKVAHPRSRGFSIWDKPVVLGEKRSRNKDRCSHQGRRGVHLQGEAYRVKRW